MTWFWLGGDWPQSRSTGLWKSWSDIGHTLSVWPHDGWTSTTSSFML